MFDLSLMALVSLAIGLVVGKALFERRGSESGRRASAAFSVLTSVFWLSAGVFAILGGFYIAGAIVVALMLFFALSNYAIATGNGGIRARIAGSR